MDHDARLVRAAVEGNFTIEDMLDCVSGAAAEAGGPGYNVLSDHREIGEPATRPQLEALVSHIAALRQYFGGARWAVIVTTPASYGMMRMLSVLAERVPMEVRVFRAADAEAAELWARGAVDPNVVRAGVLPSSA